MSRMKTVHKYGQTIGLTDEIGYSLTTDTRKSQQLFIPGGGTLTEVGVRNDYRQRQISAAPHLVSIRALVVCCGSNQFRSYM